MIVFVLFMVFMLHHKVEMIKVKIAEGWLEGEQLDLITEDGQYYSFKGIPYAQPPLGNLRFKAPQPPKNWTGVWNATEHGSVCTQVDILTKEIIGSEDCLFLNVYTPDLKPEKPLSVMFFIHGGGYETDSGNVGNYGPDFLVQNDVILVTFNYRLGAFGFLSLENEKVPGNAGMKDQVAALKWVKRNIREFGGDPENITVFGQSAGGASAIFHMLSPMSKGLLKRAISMSGVPSCDWSISYQPRRRAFVLGKLLGKDTNNDKELLEYLRSVPAETIVGNNPNVVTSEKIPAKIFKIFYFTPVIEKDFGDEHFITERPEELLKKGNLEPIDLMIGRTSEEALIDFSLFKETFLSSYPIYAELLVPQKIVYEKSSNDILELSDIIKDKYFGTKPINDHSLKKFLTYLNDSIYGYNIYKYIELFANISGLNMYVYKFSGVSDRNIYGKMGAKYNLEGASHLDDTTHLFDPKNAKFTLKNDSKGYRISKHISELFANFAKHGNPTPDLKWPVYDNKTHSYLDIGESLTLGTGLDADVAAFWKTVYEKAGVNFY